MPGRLLTLYHHTSNAAAAAILRDSSMISAAPVDLPFAFFSTHREGRAAGPLNYGEAAVEVRVPEDLAQVDETFRDGERFVKVRPRRSASRALHPRPFPRGPPAR